jgi:hypothetical protein
MVRCQLHYVDEVLVACICALIIVAVLAGLMAVLGKIVLCYLSRLPSATGEKKKRELSKD